MYNRGFVVERPGFVSQSFHIDNHNSNGYDGTTHVATSTTIYSGTRGRAFLEKKVSYGTLQTMNPLIGDRFATPLRPKYYFSMTHFGHYSDLMRQGLDSRCIISSKGQTEKAAQRRSRRGRGIPSPVRARFVTGSVDDTASIKSYYSTNRPDSLFFVTSSFSAINSLFPSIERPTVVFTKGNVSLFSTSSFGFAEDGPMPTPTPVGTMILPAAFTGLAPIGDAYVETSYVSYLAGLG